MTMTFRFRFLFLRSLAQMFAFGFSVDSPELTRVTPGFNFMSSNKCDLPGPSSPNNLDSSHNIQNSKFGSVPLLPTLKLHAEYFVSKILTTAYGFRIAVG
ncbi:hypothetical protein CIPAW_10G050300 [Carya illinoinensis]|uniref:Secreted protein n=1 Tax=Carya illinoinensis TaxID=32201 RepID=A0A8T1P2H4_CARIL|nr:hypothetical protein CIPAW_10G050300 [Carya illinoinensis]